MPKGKNAASKGKLSSKSKLRKSSKSKSRSKSPKSKLAKKAASKKTAPARGGVKQGGDRKKIRFRPGTVALREIRRYQKSTDLLLPRAPFQRVVRALTGEVDHDVRFAAQALLAL